MTKLDPLRHATIDGRALRQAMTAVDAIIERRNTIPILGYARVSLGATGLTVKATNLDMEIAVTADVMSGQGEWAICVPADALKRIAAIAGVEDVRIEPGDIHATVKVGHDAVYDLPKLPTTEYPDQLSEIERGDLIETFTNGRFTMLLDKVRPCISTEETRYYLNGVYWHGGPTGRHMVATDGHRLHACRYSAEPSEFPSMIIPRRAVAVAIDLMAGKDVKVFAMAKPNTVEIVAPGIRLITKLIDGTYPDYARVVPKPESLTNAIEFVVDDLRAAIRKAEAVNSGCHRALKFAAHDGHAEISRQTPDFGSVKVQTRASWPDQYTDSFGLNGKYAQEIVSTCEGRVRILWSDSSSPFEFRDSDESMTRCLMPMRV